MVVAAVQQVRQIFEVLELVDQQVKLRERVQVGVLQSQVSKISCSQAGELTLCGRFSRC